MKYILMMTGNRAGVDAYRAWSPGDVQAHFAHLKALNEDLLESGELVDNQPLTPPEQAKVVITHFRIAADGTSSIPERDYLIAQAARLSASAPRAPGRGR
jgi:hypothetical protein